MFHKIMLIFAFVKVKTIKIYKKKFDIQIEWRYISLQVSRTLLSV